MKEDVVYNQHPPSSHHTVTTPELESFLKRNKQNKLESKQRCAYQGEYSNPSPFMKVCKSCGCRMSCRSGSEYCFEKDIINKFCRWCWRYGTCKAKALDMRSREDFEHAASAERKIIEYSDAEVKEIHSIIDKLEAGNPPDTEMANMYRSQINEKPKVVRRPSNYTDHEYAEDKEIESLWPKKLSELCRGVATTHLSETRSDSNIERRSIAKLNCSYGHMFGTKSTYEDCYGLCTKRLECETARKRCDMVSEPDMVSCRSCYRKATCLSVHKSCC